MWLSIYFKKKRIHHCEQLYRKDFKIIFGKLSEQMLESAIHDWWMVINWFVGAT